MPNPTDKPKSEKRGRDAKPFLVRVSQEERDLLIQSGENTGLHPSTLMRQLGLGYEPRSVLDQRAARELLRLRGDLGRVGGLLKKHINESTGKGTQMAVGLIRDIDDLKDEIRAQVDALKEAL